MGAPFFTSNDSEIARLEGLYIKERNPPAQITGTFLGVVGIVGQTVRGPVDKAVEITSEARFREVFGGRDRGSGGSLLNHVWLAMLNKKFGKVVVVRAADDAAVAAKSEWDATAGAGGTNIVRIVASSVGAWGGDVKFGIFAATDGVANHWDLKIKYLGTIYHYKNLDTQAGTDNLAAAIGTDDGRIVDVTKLADGRPVNTLGETGADADGYVTLGVGGNNVAAGSDGTIADADYTGTGRCMDKIEYYPGVGVVFVAGRSNAAIKASMKTRAARSSDRLFLICPDSESVSLASAVTDVASYRDQRLVYCFNHAYTLDPETAGEVVTEPHAWMASILSQTDVMIDPGDEDTKKLNAGIIRLYNQGFTREDYISFKNAGIAAMEKDDDGFVFVSSVLTDLTSAKEYITRRREADFILLSLAKFMKNFVKKENTHARRMVQAGTIEAWLEGYKKLGTIVEDYIVDPEKLNTTASRAANIEKLLVRVKLLGHMRHLVLEAEIGTTVTITEVN